jgi:hypothetical protein
MEYYRKVLSNIEAKRHFIYVSCKAQTIFPPKGQPFTLVVGSNEFPCTIDKQGRIWANANLLKDYLEFKRWNVFIFTKKSPDKFRVACEHLPSA